MTSARQPLLRSYRPSDHDALVSLWSRCGLLRPWNDPSHDIQRKLAHDPDGLLVLQAGDRLAGAVMAGYDGHRGWVNYLAVDPAYQRQGLGRLLMHEAELRLLAAGCPKVNLQVRTSNQDAVAFYRHLGYYIDDVVSMGRRLADDATPRPSSDSRPPRAADPQAHRTPGSGRSTSLPASTRRPRRSGGSRAKAVTSDRHGARPALQSADEPERRILTAELSTGRSVRDAQIVQFGVVAARSAPRLPLATVPIRG